MLLIVCQLLYHTPIDHADKSELYSTVPARFCKKILHRLKTNCGSDKQYSNFHIHFLTLNICIALICFSFFILKLRNFFHNFKISSTFFIHETCNGIIEKVFARRTLLIWYKEMKRRKNEATLPLYFWSKGCR